MPVPASRMMRVSPATTSTQDVLPPAVRPGVAIEPRTPRKRQVRSVLVMTWQRAASMPAQLPDLAACSCFVLELLRSVLEQPRSRSQQSKPLQESAQSVTEPRERLAPPRQAKPCRFVVLRRSSGDRGRTRRRALHRSRDRGSRASPRGCASGSARRSCSCRSSTTRRRPLRSSRASSGRCQRRISTPRRASRRST